MKPGSYSLVLNSTDLSRILKTLKPGPACTWRVFTLVLDLEMLVFICGKLCSAF